MKYYHFLAPLAGAMFLLATACNKDATAPGTEEPSQGAKISLSIASAPGTKAGGEQWNKLNSVEVFIFDNDANSSSKGFLEAYKKAAASDFKNSNTSAQLSFNASAGPKHIYVLANVPASIGESVSLESQLKAIITELKDNSETSFIMVGSTEKTLKTNNVNEIALSCRRLVSKISFGTVKGAFESPALRSLKFTVDRVYLMNVPKQAKLINGDAADAFGTLGVSAFAEGSSSCPDIFQPAIKQGTDLFPYYKYANPATNGTSANGYYNWFNASSFVVNTPMTLSTDASALTTFNVTSGMIYPTSTTGNTVTINKNFYTYPNPAAHSTSDTVADNTTKVIVETTLVINGINKKYYYPISIPYTQPNYFYNIESLTIKRLGTDDPSKPVTKAQCSFTITVRDWDTGKIVGMFNNETSDGVFVF